MYTFITWNEDISLETPQTIRGEKFHYFLELCFSQADYFSLKTAEWATSNEGNARSELQPFLLKQFVTPKWFGYDLTLAPPNARNTIEIQIYRATTESKNILLKYFSDVFLNEENNGELVESVQNIEDICFFTTEYIVATSVSHAELLLVNPDAKKIVEQLDHFGKWRYNENDRLDLSLMTQLGL